MEQRQFQKKALSLWVLSVLEKPLMLSENKFLESHVWWHEYTIIHSPFTSEITPQHWCFFFLPREVNFSPITIQTAKPSLVGTAAFLHLGSVVPLNQLLECHRKEIILFFFLLFTLIDPQPYSYSSEFSTRCFIPGTAKEDFS